MKMFLNWSRAGGLFHLSSRMPPWCCRPIRPRTGKPGIWAPGITDLPFRIAVTVLPRTVNSFWFVMQFFAAGHRLQFP